MLERTHIFMSVWCFTAVEKNKTKVCRIAHVDPKGLISAFVINAAIGKHVAIVEKLGK